MTLNPTTPQGSRPPTVEALDSTVIPHACEPETLPSRRASFGARLLGVDVARALALIGMIAVHLLSEVNSQGVMSVPFVLAAGNSSALFAVLAGVGIAFSTGRDHPPNGRPWVGAMLRVVVRAVLIIAIGLALGSLVPPDRAHVILAAYGVMFLLAVPLLRLPAAVLAILAGVFAVGLPILSHLLRQDIPITATTNPTFTDLFTEPGSTLRELVLTGTFPALPWMAYLCAGLAIGRLSLQLRGPAIRITAIGIASLLLASTGSWILLQRMGGLEALGAAAAPIMSRQDFADTLVWGAEGTLPTNSAWWLAVLAPHTTTPFDLAYTMGVALTVLGLALIFAVVAPAAFRPLARFGSMPLTMYALHLVLLVLPFLPEDGVVAFGIHVVVLAVVALAWGRFFKRGPLEHVLWWIAHRATRPVTGSSSGSITS
ncbi:MAG: heparan-alpha-glucosaminide N-acetyltransferase domain-containing protein [Propionibacteriaceae bacterium]|nr:heparan-alpha-glucosaminide N-acetyltransferase domain-containing protein [Propionibacteriaceae bacterium]